MEDVNSATGFIRVSQSKEGTQRRKDNQIPTALKFAEHFSVVSREQIVLN